MVRPRRASLRARGYRLPLILGGRRLNRRTRIALLTLLALAPLALVAQTGSPARSALLSGGAAVAIPFSGPGWQDKVLNYEGYVMPPPELAAAVLAPRGLNVTLSGLSPDKKWFLDEV